MGNPSILRRCATTGIGQRYLASACQVANVLNWQKSWGGTVASISVLKDHVDIVIGTHPDECCDTVTEPLIAATVRQTESVPLVWHQVETKKQNKKVLDASTLHQLEQLVDQHRVCGIIVNWPIATKLHGMKVPPPTNHWNAECGRVLHLLENIHLHGTVLKACQPICLYNNNQTHGVGHHPFVRTSIFAQQQLSRTTVCDDFGRDPRFAFTKSTADELFMLKRSSSNADNMEYLYSSKMEELPVKAMDVWNHFCNTQYHEKFVVDDASSERTSKLHHQSQEPARSLIPKRRNGTWNAISVYPNTTKKNLITKGKKLMTL